MNLNVSGIMGKLQKNAEWLALLAGLYERYPSVGGLMEHLNPLNKMGAMAEIQRTLSDFGLLKHKLLDSPHLYTSMFKGSIIAYLLAELGIIPSKYKKLASKIAWGSGAAAVTMPASYQGSSSKSNLSGGNPMEGVYNI